MAFVRHSEYGKLSIEMKNMSFTLIDVALMLNTDSTSPSFGVILVVLCKLSLIHTRRCLTGKHEIIDGHVMQTSHL